MGINDNHQHRTIVKIICVLILIPILPCLYVHQYRQPLVIDIILLEIVFGVIQEFLYLIKNYTK